LRALGIGVVAKLELSKSRSTGADSSKAVVGKHKIYYKGKFVSAPIYDRYKLKPGNVVEGPAVITQNDSTTLILPKHYGRVDAYQNILIFPNGYEAKASAAKAKTNGKLNGKSKAKTKPAAKTRKR
jgi:N-methylhydantoinase A